MAILLVPIGRIETEILEYLRDALGRTFAKDILIGNPVPEPEYAYNRKRKQYHSTAILKVISMQKEYRGYERILGIVDHDLYVPELNFVFGEAGTRAAIISLSRLRQEFYGLPCNKEIFYRRALTEAVHELGHTYGLGHCSNPGCVMYFSNTLMDTDRKGPGFCKSCREELKYRL